MVHDRRTIGLVVSQATSSYDHSLYEGVRAAARSRELDVVTLLCASLDSTIWHPFEGQNNLLYGLPSKGVFDGLVLPPAILYNYSTPERARQVLAGFRGIPMVTVSEAVDGHPGVFVDNASGVRGLVRHMSDRHDRRRLAFISGPAGNADAVDRLQGFIEGIVDSGLDFDERMIYEGNFWLTGGRDGARAFFDGPRAYKPDAIVCANDYMAFGAREVLQSLGLRVPEDVVLAGFDNEPDSRFTNPPLTTIEPPLDQMADCAVEILMGLMRGEDVPRRTVLPTRTIFRRSCGCHQSDVEAVPSERWQSEIADDVLSCRVRAWVDNAKLASALDPHSRATLLDSLYDLFSLARERGRIAQVRSLVPTLLDANLNDQSRARMALRDGIQAISFEMKEMELGLEAAQNTAGKQREVVALQNIITVHTAEELFSRFVEELPALGVTTMFLNLFARPFEHVPRQKWSVPGRVRCVFGYVDGERLDLPSGGRLFKTAQLVPDVAQLAGKSRHLITLSCFFKQEVYGFIVLESAGDDMVGLNNLAAHISSAYHSILGYRQLERSSRSLERALRQLQASNRRLDELSTRDSLTGLYNRRGFELIGEKLHEMAARNDSDYLLFFADMDGLKTINDTWGHKAGDEAIAACAEILRRTFRAADLVARPGGDEFTILVAAPSRDAVTAMLARLDEALDQHNHRRDARPYAIGLSIGYVFYSDCPNLSFTDVMARADDELYRQKQQRRPSKQWPRAV